MASPFVKKSPYKVITSEDIRLFNKLNSCIRIRDEYNITCSQIPILSNTTHTISSSQKETNNSPAYSKRMDDNLHKDDNISIKTSNFGKETSIASSWQYFWPFLSKNQWKHKSNKRLVYPKLAKVLELERGKIGYIFHSIAAILRVFVLFILFCLVLSSTSYSFGDIYSDCVKLNRDMEHFCHPEMNFGIHQSTCKESHIRIGNIECIPKDESNLKLVELYNVTLQILQEQWKTKCSFWSCFHDWGMTIEELKHIISMKHDYQDLTEIFEKMPFYLSRTPGIVWKTTLSQPIRYYYVLPWNIAAWKCWFGIQCRQHWLFAAALACCISQVPLFHLR